MESWGEKLVELEERAKSNSHRISDLEADNRALHHLATSVEVLATKQEAIVKGVITALIAGLIGFALAKLGLG